MIVRPLYVEKILKFKDVKLVKILAGVRRSGKSTIFEMIRDVLIEEGIDRSNIIFKNYTDISKENMNSKEMLEDILKDIENKGRCYLFLDELQEIESWEKVCNELLEHYDVDIYVTGSNSKLMSSEISSYLTGRYVQIPVYTLSFEEYLDFKKDDTRSHKELLNEYIKLGGFPLIASRSFEMNEAYQVVSDIYNTVISIDITKRHQIRDFDLFDRVVRYIIENVGKTFSANSIVKFLKSEQRKVSIETIYNYLKWLEEAFIIYPCRRYNLQGKSVLKTQEKYYLSDVSFKYSKFGFSSYMVASILENIVFLELKRRGYDVYIGKNGDKEIDFVAQLREQRIYVQVSRTIPENSDREIGNLLEINDQYHKYVVTLDELAVGNINGVEVIHLSDFLLKKNL